MDLCRVNSPYRSIADLISRLLHLDILRFLLVGVLNTAFGYVIYLVGLYLGLSAGVALAAATTIGALFNYATTGRLVFKQAGLGKLLPFLVAYLLIYLVNLGALHGLIALGATALWAQAVLLPVVAVGSFVVFKYFVFGNGWARWRAG